MDWKNSKATVCTMHGKEAVIQSALRSFGFKWIFTDLNTDQFGTFTGEIERLSNPLESARKKCQLAFENTDATISIASEGSFGPHPSVPFIPVNEELLLFIDRKSGIEVAVQSISIETNFSSLVSSKWDEVEFFASQIGFPTHGLIIKADADKIVHKGITTSDELRSLFDRLTSIFGSVTIETDMRAMHNPTRMKHIHQAAEKLSAKLISKCPSCYMPGFGEEQFQSGLPCAQCGLPTASFLLKTISCQHCNHQSIINFPSGKEVEDPQYCSFCNP